MQHTFVPTMYLRFTRRKSKRFPDETGHRYILQQKWAAPDGRFKWVDVPRTSEEDPLEIDPRRGEAA